MSTVLITGGAGFFGSILTNYLLEQGQACVVVDLNRSDISHPLLSTVQGDIRNKELVHGLFRSHEITTVFHCAAILAHAVRDQRFLWESNVEGTRHVVEAAVAHAARSIVFLSSNCLWGTGMGRPVLETDEPAPVEIYGRSKLQAEQILSGFSDRINAVTIRCPTIVDEGRLGLLAILFEFIDEGRRVWAVGAGKNRYQFIYAKDLVKACLRAAQSSKSATYNVGSDNVTTLGETFQYVIDRAETGARMCALPKAPAIAAMRLAHALKISPLGPYQYRMIAEDFVFDTSSIKADLGWRPTLTNNEMLWRAYDYFHSNRNEIEARHGVSAHRQAAKMGIIRLLKWVS